MARAVFANNPPKKTMFVSRLGRLHQFFVCTFLCFFLMPGYLNSSLMLSGEAIDSKTLLASTRCRARCLNKLETYLASLEKLGLSSILLRQQHSASLETCLQDQSCSSCIRPCDLKPSNYAACPAYCQDEDSDCHGTCAFLREMEEKGVTPSICPQPDHPPPYATSFCVSSCDIDSDCDTGFKCCSVGCEKSCRRSVPATGQPPLPQNLNAIERKNARSVTLHWTIEGNPRGPLIFIVQSKSHVGKDYNRLLMPQEWRHVALVVDRHEVTIKEMELGHWYVFRVSAVNANGSAGFSVSDGPFKLKTEPRAPSLPTNMTEVDKKVVDGKYAVSVDWEPPLQADLPINKYKIFWSRRMQGDTTIFNNLKEHKKTVQGKITKYTFEGLEPDCVYLIQVQALIQYGDTKLRSKKANLFVTTFSAEKNLDDFELFPSNANEFEEEEEKEVVSTPTPIPDPILNLTHENPFFKDGVIKAKIKWAPINRENTRQVMIHWAPDVCIADQSTIKGPITKTFTATTEEDYYHIFDLRFDCRYIVKAWGMSPTGTLGKPTSTSFFVHGCHDIKIEDTSLVLPACPTAAPPDAPSKPLNVTYLYLIGTGRTINVRFMWNYPRHSDRPLTGWRVTWGQRLHLLQPSLPRPVFPDGRVRGNPVLNEKNAAVTQVIPESELEFTINDLQEATDYIFQLQALSEVGDGEAVQILLTTPQLSMESIEEQSIGRGYRRGGATVEMGEPYDVSEYPQLDYDEEINYFNHRNAKTLRTLSESFPNNGASFAWQYYDYYGITWALLSTYVLSMIQI